MREDRKVKLCHCSPEIFRFSKGCFLLFAMHCSPNMAEDWQQTFPGNEASQLKSIFLV